MATGKVIEEGVVNGIPYRVWQAYGSGKKIVYSGYKDFGNGRLGKRHGMKWLKKQKKLQTKKENENER